MAKCYKCGRKIGFLKRKGKNSLVVNMTPVFFIPDLKGDVYLIHDGVMKRGTPAKDGLKGYTLHSCEVR